VLPGGSYKLNPKEQCFLPLAGMPAELVAHFDPRTPLLAGAVAPAEAGTGFLRLRLKRHRWFPKILKTRDPLIFSIGVFMFSHSLVGCSVPASPI
jgi:ribosome biogenesis protein BMS1